MDGDQSEELDEIQQYDKFVNVEVTAPVVHQPHQTPNGWWRLKHATVGILVLSIMLVVGIITGLAFRSQAVAVDRTRDSHATAMDKCFATADNQIDLQLNAYMTTFTSNVYEKVFSFLENIRRIAVKHHFILLAELAKNSTVVTADFLESKLLFLQAELVNQRVNGLVAIGILTVNFSFLVLEDSSTMGLPETVPHMDIVLHGGPEHLFISGTVNGTLEGDPQPFPNLTSRTVPAIRIVLEHADLPLNQPHWGGAYAFYEYVGSDVVVPFAINGVRSGAVIARNDLRAMSAFLKKSANEAKEFLANTELRLFAYVQCNKSSYEPAYDEKFLIRVHNDVGTIMGVSHGDHQWHLDSSEPIQPIPLHLAYDNLIRAVGTLLTCTDIDPDASYCEGVPKMQKVPLQSDTNISLVNVTYVEQDDNGAPLSADEKVPTVTSNFYVATKDIHDTIGTNWRLCVVVDHDKLVENVTKTIIALKRKLDQSDERVQSDVSRDRMILMITVIGTALLMSAGSAMLTSLLLKPLLELQKQMNDVAHMKLDRVSEHQPASRLFEVATMQTAFLSMLKRLKEFRPYIPAYILSDETSSESKTPSSRDDNDTNNKRNSVPAATGVPPLVFSNPLNTQARSQPRREVDPPSGDNLTLVFTDIQGSTQLWEKIGSTMEEAMNIHNDVIRKTMEEHGGFEVKVIGDAFMVAFKHVLDACKFALESQENLLSAPWPETMCVADEKDPKDVKDAKENCKREVSPSGQVIWKGLRVKIGMHVGNAVRITTPTTGRADYMGTTVNAAARVEGQAVGGLVVVSRAVLDALGSEGMQKLNDPFMINIGPRKVKGFDAPMDLKGFVPAKLKDRAEVIRAMLSCRDAQNAEPAMINSKLQTMLKPTDATVVYVQPAYAKKFPSATENMSSVVQFTNSIFVAAETAAERCNGMIMDGAGGCITISFNVSKSCKRHWSKASTFIGLMHEQVEKDVNIGAATGTVAVGNIGGKKHRFSTVLGHTLDLSVLLSKSACSLGTFALAASINNEQGIARAEPINTRPVDKWNYLGSTLIVYELKSSALAPSDNAWEKMIQDTDQWSSVQLTTALSNTDLGPLRKLVLERKDDEVLKRVLEMLERGASLQPSAFPLPLQPSVAPVRENSGQNSVSMPHLVPHPQQSPTHFPPLRGQQPNPPMVFSSLMSGRRVSDSSAQP